MKIFAVSDIHSYYTPFKKVLDEKGFEPNNPDHLLVVCGDVFDRGPESAETLKFFSKLSNVVLVKGNHEVLMEKVWQRGHCKHHDVSNGTLRTIQDLCYTEANEDLHDAIKLSEELLKPLFARMVDYFETKNYVFVHGWIPMKYDTTKEFAEYSEPTLFDPNWRGGDWEMARWFNGIKKAYNGIIIPDKTIVCGHWHCSYGHYIKALKKAVKNNTELDHEEFGKTAIWRPFKAKGILAIDRCTAHTGKVNVVVLEDELLEET